MTEFVQQRIAYPGGDLVVIAHPTACEYLVITPGIGHRQDGSRELLGSLTLTHTLTGRSVTQGERVSHLLDYASRLVGIDWNFTDPDHFKKPENAGALDALTQAWRDWNMAGTYQGPVYFSGDPEELQARRAADPAGTYLSEQIEWWLKHQKALWDKESGMPTHESNPQARAAEIALSCEGYAEIYLLAVLRAVDPRVADIAARSLIANLDAGDTLGEWVSQWHEELTSGKSLTLRGIPSGDPTGELGAAE